MVIDKNRQQFLLMKLDAIISNHWLLSRECLVTFYQRKKKDKQQQQLTVVLAEYCPQKMVLGSVIPSLGQRSVIIWKDNRENVSTQLLAGDVSLKISQRENWAFEVKKKKKKGRRWYIFTWVWRVLRSESFKHFRMLLFWCGEWGHYNMKYPRGEYEPHCSAFHLHCFAFYW